MRFRAPVPTMGYPSQKKAIVALHEAGVAPQDIAKQLGIASNSVHRAIHDYRVATGVRQPVSKPTVRPKVESFISADADEHARRMAIYSRAVRGARRALREVSAQ